MNARNIDLLARLIGSEADRRTILKGLAGGAVGLAAMAPEGSTKAALSALQGADCAQLLVFARQVEETDVGDAQCGDPCACDDRRVFTLGQDSKAKLAIVNDCDETGGVIPDGSILHVTLNRTLRLPGPHGTWVGYHSGAFEIVSAESGEIVVQGKLWGTDGLDSEQAACDQPERDEGMLIGTGVGNLAGCEFLTVYRSIVEVPDRENPCSVDWRSWRLSLAGILACPRCGDVAPATAVCQDFTVLAPTTGPNPLSGSGIDFTVYESGGTTAGATEVRSMVAGGPVGLNCGFRLEVAVPPSSEVDLTLVHYAAPATITAYSGGPSGSVVVTAKMSSTQKIAQPIQLTGAGIDFVVIEPPSDETLLLTICYTV